MILLIESMERFRLPATTRVQKLWALNPAFCAKYRCENEGLSSFFALKNIGKEYAVIVIFKNHLQDLFSLDGFCCWKSCIKSLSTGTDFSGLKPTVLIPDGGMANFSSNALLFPPTDAVDTTHFFLNYALTTTAPQDEVIAIEIRRRPCCL